MFINWHQCHENKSLNIINTTIWTIKLSTFLFSENVLMSYTAYSAVNTNGSATWWNWQVTYLRLSAKWTLVSGIRAMCNYTTARHAMNTTLPVDFCGKWAGITIQFHCPCSNLGIKVSSSLDHKANRRKAQAIWPRPAVGDYGQRSNDAALTPGEGYRHPTAIGKSDILQII